MRGSGGSPARRPAPREPHGLSAGAAAALALLWLLLCAPGRAGCRLLTVADLFDRVIQHSGRIHSLSTALYAELVSAGPASLPRTWVPPPWERLPAGLGGLRSVCL